MNAAIDLDAPGNLYGCSECNLLFRSPVPSPVELVQAYAKLADNLWCSSFIRLDYELAHANILENFSSGKILDVGCYRGDFLITLPEIYERFGIEPSESARQIAIKRGVKIIASSIEEFQVNNQRFDAIVLIDVIEHLVHPFESLRILGGALLPGGILIISTGNTDSLPWRLLRNEYWYYFLDHISFFNRAWFEWVAKKLSLRLESVQLFSHSGVNSPLAPWFELIHTIFYRLTGPKWMVYRVACRLMKMSGYPVTSAWRDHFLVVLRKPML